MAGQRERGSSAAEVMEESLERVRELLEVLRLTICIEEQERAKRDVRINEELERVQRLMDRLTFAMLK